MSEISIKRDVKLAEFTTFKIGGLARFFVEARSESDVMNTFNEAAKDNLEVFVLGGGSNVLISDKGFDGIVLKIALRGISLVETGGSEVLVTAKAGEDWDDFVEFCVAKKLAGIECLSGIPGLVGGTPIQNVGAYGQEVSETIQSVRVYDRKNDEIRSLTNKQCRFAYRKSIFNSKEKERYVVLAVIYSLEKEGKPTIVYRDLKEKFEKHEPTLRETRDAVCEIRRGKGMLVRQGGLDAQSAGSFFKNPVVGSEKLREVGERLAASGAGEIPQYVMDTETFKIPAAWLIEQAGFTKGYTKGNAGLSTKHTLALTNRGNSTAREILELKKEIQTRVFESFGIELVPEPNLIGFDGEK